MTNRQFKGAGIAAVLALMAGIGHAPNGLTAEQPIPAVEIDARLSMFELQRNGAMNVIVVQHGTIERLKKELQDALAKAAVCRPDEEKK